MPWVLDGNNLARGGDRERVRRAALALARRERVRILVLFDGAPPTGAAAVERLGAVEVRYVSDADAAIVAAIGGGARAWRLATDDRALAARARASGAAVVGSATFWRWVEKDAPGGTKPSSGPADTEQEAAYFTDPAHALPARPHRVVRRRHPAAARKR